MDDSTGSIRESFDPTTFRDGVVNSTGPLTTQQAARAYWETLIHELKGYGATELTEGIPPTWEGILRLEEIAIELLRPERLIRRAWIIRNRFREVAGEVKYSLYTASNPPALSLPAHGDSQKIDVDALRADLLEVHRETTREYIFGNALEHQRGQLSRRATFVAICALMLLGITLAWTFLPDSWRPIAAAIAGGVIVVFIIFALLRSRHPQHAAAMLLALGLACAAQAQVPAQPAQGATASNAKTPAAQQSVTDTAAKQAAEEKVRPPEEFREPEKFPGRPGPATTLTMVVMAGVLGATFSLIRRAQAPTMDGDAMRNVQNLSAADTYFFLTPLTGAIAALVLYAFFCGGLLEGSLFPRITCPPGIKQPMRFIDFLLNADPVSWPDQGKALVWCFIAGFAERLVPDAIDRLTSAAQKK